MSFLFQKPPTEDVSLQQNLEDMTVGALDLGGASTQITFHMTGSNKNLTNYTENLTLYGNNYTVYTHSYLCYGINEAIRRYQAVLVHVSIHSKFIIVNNLFFCFCFMPYQQYFSYLTVTVNKSTFPGLFL